MPGAGKCSVLLVDDDEVVLMVATRVLEEMGFVVTGVGSLHLAVASVLSNPGVFDILVTDYRLLGGDTGFDVAREVRQLTPGMPVVLISGHVDEGLRAEANGLGIRSVLEKSPAFAGLHEAIDQAVAA